MKTSKIQRNKTIALALAAVLTLTAALITCLPIAAAQKTEVTAYLSFRPNPIGVNQELLINAWVTPIPLMGPDLSLPPSRTNYMVYFTDPDGNIDTVGPLDSNSDGTIWFTYKPDQVGNWTIQFSWPGDEDFAACQTEKQPLTVQQDPIPSWPAAPLPTGSWTFPINPENREWSQIAGSWFGVGYNASQPNYNPYSQAPSSSHILWKLPSPDGLSGLIGGEFGTAGWYEGYAISIDTVMAGRAYYQSGGMIHCLDLRTGTELWTTPGSFTQAIIDAAPVYHEGQVSGYTNAPRLINVDSMLIKYDALTGEVLLNVTSITGTHLIDNPYVYTHDGQNLTKWSIFGDTANFSERVIWTTEAPWLFVYRADSDAIVSILGGFDFIGSGAINATSGDVLWYSTDAPFINENPNPTIAYGKIVYPSLDGHYAAVDIKTGETAWLSEQADYPWGAFWGYGTAAAYDLIYGIGYDGIYAFDQHTGSIVWHFRAGDSGFETPYSTWSFFETPKVADGKIYAAAGEHHISYPTFRGQELYCVNALTGDPIWSIMGYYTTTAIAQGTLFANNAYDACSYAFAKGETATTISASPEVAAKGSSILIKGTVLDLSPAQPNTPAISDDSMSAWMEYLHMQQPKPTNATGVPVTLSVLDQNNNTYVIGATASDADGNFGLAWTPPVPGLYKVTATFEGSNSYYSSHAATMVVVSTAPAASVVTPAPTQTAAPTSSPVQSASPLPSQAEAPTSGIPTTTYIAIAAAVVILAVVAAAVVLRRRK